MSVGELADAMNLSQGVREHLFPKNVGLLMFSEEPGRFFKGIQIDVVEFPEGLEAKEFNEKTFNGPIQKQLVDALSYLKTNIIRSKVTKFDFYLSGSGGSDERDSRNEKMKGYEIHMGVSKVVGSGNGLMSVFNINRRGDEKTALEDGLLKLDTENKKWYSAPIYMVFLIIICSEEA